MFDFYTGDDPVMGYVNFLNEEDAVQRKLFQVMPNNSIYIGVDSENRVEGKGRESIRLHSKRRYNHGLFILDLAHMPVSICGTWVSFWLYGWDRPWPQDGEIHIIKSKSNTSNFTKSYSF